MITDTSERGLENLIVSTLTGLPLGSSLGGDDHTAYPLAAYGGLGYVLGFPHDYDREYGVDLHHLREFFASTQPDVLESFDLENDSPTRRGFLARLQGKVAKHGVVDVSFLFPTQGFWFFSWIPGFLRAKTQASLTFSYPLKMIRNLKTEVSVKDPRSSTPRFHSRLPYTRCSVVDTSWRASESPSPRSRI